MKTNREHSEISTIIPVYCGIPVLAEAYSDDARVIDRAEELKAGTNPEYEAVDVFPAQLK